MVKSGILSLIEMVCTGGGAMLKVLIVDDNPSVYNGLKRIVPWEQLNAEIVGACGNGEEALELALELQPDLIITDVRMPVMDGLELCKHVHDLVPNASLIILSAFQDFSYAQTAIRYGVIDYILKPIDKPKLSELIRKISDISENHDMQERYYTLLYDDSTKEKLEACLKSGKAADLSVYFEYAFKQIESSNFQTTRNICYKFHSILFEALRNIDVSLEPMGISQEQSWRRLNQAKTKEEMRNYVRQVCESVIQWIQERKHARSEIVAERVKSILQIKYTDPEFTIYSIAAELNLSPNYISAIFRQNIGDNINAYLTRMRITHARKLLKQTSETVQDISRIVGYSDSHYFAKVFKKSEGFTPSQYRNIALSQGSVGS
jgi:two-component system response regulator YesN